MNKLQKIQLAFLDQMLSKSTNLEQFILNNGIHTNKKRIKIYTDGYKLRLLESLKNNYEILLSYMGENKFEKTALLYVKQYPSKYKSIRDYGNNFAWFILFETNLRNKQFLSNLARFEWAIEKSFDAKDSQSLSVLDLQDIDPEDWSEMRLSFHSSVSIEKFDYDMKSAWATLQDNSYKAKLEIERQKQNIIFWRSENTNFYKVVDNLELIALELAINNKSFTELCDGIIKVSNLTEIETINKTAGFLKQWVSDGLIVGVYKHLILRGNCDER